MSETRRVAIVTGSSSGVGAATVEQLAAKGWNVVINYSRSDAAAEAVAERCRVAGAEVHVQRANVASDDDCRALVAGALGRFERLDALVNSAGTKFVNHADLDGLMDDFTIYGVNTVGRIR